VHSFGIAALGPPVPTLHTAANIGPPAHHAGSPLKTDDAAPGLPDSANWEDHFAEALIPLQPLNQPLAGPSFLNNNTRVLPPPVGKNDTLDDPHGTLEFAEARAATDAGEFLCKRFNIAVITKSVWGQVRMKNLVIRWKAILQLCQVMGPKAENRLGWLKDGWFNRLKVPAGMTVILVAASLLLTTSMVMYDR
jgi:hypothetical protein